MKQYLIALDMDGTLLNDEKNITPRTEKVLIDLKKQGHKIIFASGRPYRTMLRYYEQLGLDTPIIGYNGGAIYCMKSTFPTKETTFDLQDVLKIYQFYGNDELKNIICESSSSIYLLKDDEVFSTWFSYEHLQKHIGDLKETLKENPMTMLFHFKENASAKRLSDIVKKVNSDLFVRVWSGGEFAELSYISISKYKAIREVADFYQIPQDHVLVFGDAGNDIEMLSNFELSVAMINGTPETKKSAKYITKKDNNHDGIALFLEEYFQQEKKKRA